MAWLLAGMVAGISSTKVRVGEPAGFCAGSWYRAVVAEALLCPFGAARLPRGNRKKIAPLEGNIVACEVGLKLGRSLMRTAPFEFKDGLDFGAGPGSISLDMLKVLQYGLLVSHRGRRIPLTDEREKEMRRASSKSKRSAAVPRAVPPSHFSRRRPTNMSG